jgi:hypothetical protein|tara:strand:+ start:735 stop:938 length:204 start_codon:yes stop_codon:yes gene_type:complete
MNFNSTNEMEYICNKLAERKTELEQHMGSGAATSYEEYKRLCGFIQGLEFANQTILDLAERLEKADE